MGLILLLVFLAMLLGFSCLGIPLGVRAVCRAQGRTAAALVLAVASVGLGALAVVLPFALVMSSRVSAWGFVLVVTVCVGGIAGLAGFVLRRRFRETGRPAGGLSGAAFFLAAAAFPVNWFWLAPRLEAWFRVGWIY
jgi:hypothetical protein